MAIPNRRINFASSEEGIEIAEELRRLAEDKGYNTESTYTANITSYPDNVMSFEDKHMEYILAHPSLNPHQYIANLRLMTKIM